MGKECIETDPAHQNMPLKVGGAEMMPQRHKAFIKSLNISFSKVATRNALRDRISKKNSTGI